VRKVTPVRDRHHQVKELFLRAREVPLDARAAWLEEACGKDDALRGEIESLLTADEEMPPEYLQPSAGFELSPGVNISHYRIIEHLGTGGMGEVWLAHDETLDRRVALKFPAADRLRDLSIRHRLLREARVAAALEHPSICRVFELGEPDGPMFIAMEHVEGETLAARLARGPVPLPQALSWSARIAAALEEAHGKGIVHRDLKPANVMITASGDIKVMDFGLARALPGAIARDGVAWSSGLSVAGMILGTPGYMAPEQVRGEAVDERADIWALGCVLYEMLTGARAFSDATPAGLIGAILHTEPAPLSELQLLTPQSLERVVRKCLAKNPKARWQNAHDLRKELQSVAEGSAEATSRVAAVPAPRSRTRRAHLAAWRRWGVAAASVVVVGLIVVLRVVGPSARPTPGRTMRFPLDSPPGQLVALELSPDGQRLAVTTQEELFEPGMRPLALTLWVRRLDRPGWRRLAVLGHAFSVAWALDSRALLYVISGELRSFDVDAAASRVLARTKGTVPWPTFDGSILVGGLPSSTLERVSSAGQVVEEWPADPNVQLVVPSASLPDGRFMVAQVGRIAEGTGVFLCKSGPRNCTRVLRSATNVSLALPGRIVYGVDGTLFSERFDATAGRITGPPEVIVTDVAHLPIGYHAFTQGPDGTIVWRPQILQSFESSLVWFDRAGGQLGTVGTPGPYRQIELSPDGRRLAMERYGEAGPGIELVDLSRNNLTRIALPASVTAVGDVVWSPGGTRLAAALAADAGPLQINVINVDRHSPKVATLAMGQDPDRHLQCPEDWSSDGRHIVYVLAPDPPPGENRDRQPRPALWSSPTRGDGRPVRLTPEGATSDQGQLTPDDRWLAYTSDETGAVEVYVQPFLREGPRQVSSSGGGQPRWRGDGRELFYLARDGTMMSVTFSSTMQPMAAKRLFTSRISTNPVLDKYVVTADGQRFLGLVPVEGPTQPQMAVLLNWQHAVSR
jgi:Tol biopolymer transport system component